MYARYINTIFMMSNCVARLWQLPFVGGSAWCDLAVRTQVVLARWRDAWPCLEPFW
jgi:hypothetical protein